MNKIKNSHGFGLVEVLVASIIIAIGLLGAASLQSTALKNMKNNSKEMMVDLLINEMAQYIIANPKEAEKGSASMYNTSCGSGFCDPKFTFSKDHTSNNCFNLTGCAIWNIAANDMSVWKTRITEILGSTASGTIGFDSTYGNTSMGYDGSMFNGLIFDQNTPVAQYPTRTTYTIKIKYQDVQGNLKIKIGQANTAFNPWASLKTKPAATVLYDPASAIPRDCSWINILTWGLAGNNMFINSVPGYSRVLYVTDPITATTECDPFSNGPYASGLIYSTGFTVNAYNPGYLTKTERDEMCVRKCTLYPGAPVNEVGICICNTSNVANSKAIN